MGTPETGAALECSGGGAASRALQSRTPDGDADTAGKRTKTAGDDEEVRAANHARRGEGRAVTQQMSGEGGPADILVEAAAHILLEVGGKACGGKGRCEHQRQRSQCKDCGGGSICEHQRPRSRCKDCGGSSI